MTTVFPSPPPLHALGAEPRDSAEATEVKGELEKLGPGPQLTLATNHEHPLDWRLTEDGIEFNTIGMRAVPRQDILDSATGAVTTPAWAQEQVFEERPDDDPVKLVLKHPSLGGGEAVSLPMQKLSGTGQYRARISVSDAALLGARTGTLPLYYGFDHGLPEGELVAPLATEFVDGPNSGSLAKLTDVSAYAWKSKPLPPLEPGEAVLMSLHVETATPAGTFRSLETQLDDLAADEVNVLQLMPTFGAPGWGYDPFSLLGFNPKYGSAQDLQHFVDAANARGIHVILDTVANHWAPTEKLLTRTAPVAVVGAGDAANGKPYDTPWGNTPNFERQHHQVTRALFEQQHETLARYFRLGTRHDAVWATHDDARPQGQPHIYAAINRIYDTVAREEKSARLTNAEYPRNEARMVRQGEHDDLGNTVVYADVLGNGIRAAFDPALQADYFRTARDNLVTILQTGSLPGTTMQEEPAWKKVFSVINHDHAGGNSLLEGPLSVQFSPAAQATLLLLQAFTPYTPMLWQGQVTGSEQSFGYWRDTQDENVKLWTRADHLLRQAFEAGVDFSRLATFQERGLPLPTSVPTEDEEKPYEIVKHALRDDQSVKAGQIVEGPLFREVRAALERTHDRLGSLRVYSDPEVLTEMTKYKVQDRADGKTPLYRQAHRAAFQLRKSKFRELRDGGHPQVTREGNVITLEHPTFSFRFNLGTVPEQGIRPQGYQLLSGFTPEFEGELKAFEAAIAS